MQTTTTSQIRGSMTMSRVLMLIAFILFLLATLVAAGAITAAMPWAVPGGLAAMTAAWLVP
jgi:hypothetical protein